MIFVFPVRLTPMRTSLSLSRTAHFGAANSTRAGWTLPAVKNWNTTFTHPFDCKTVLYSYYFQSVKNYGIAGSNAFVLINCKPWKTRMSFVTCLCYAHNVRLFVSFEYWCVRSGLKKWVIDQAWSQDGLTLATVPFSGFMDRDAVEVHKIAKNRTKPISSHLNWASLVNKGFIAWLSGNFFMRNGVGSPEGAS